MGERETLFSAVRLLRIQQQVMSSAEANEVVDDIVRMQRALEYMADYSMTGTEKTLHIDFQGKAREALRG